MMTQQSSVLNIGSVSVTAGFSNDSYYGEIYNTGSNTTYINVGSDATLNDFSIYVGETLKVYTNVLDVRAICSGTNTAVLQIFTTQ